MGSRQYCNILSGDVQSDVKSGACCLSFCDVHNRACSFIIQTSHRNVYLVIAKSLFLMAVGVGVTFLWYSILTRGLLNTLYSCT